MALINCSECGREISDKAAACPGCGAPVSPGDQSAPAIVANPPGIKAPGEQVLQTSYPAMFGQSPLLFILAVLLIAAYGAGLIILGVWWLTTRATSLTITTKRTILNRGLISKDSSEVLHQHIRNIQIKRSIFQRLVGVGAIAISSAGQSGVEIEFKGLKKPQSIKEMIDQHRGL